MMSKEAKIGLLFSLVFIVALAVILRSVHQDGNNTATDDIMVVDESPITNNNLSSAVQALADDRPQPARQPNQAQSAAPANAGGQAGSVSQVNNDHSSAPGATGTIRYRQSLPGSTDIGTSIRTTPPTGQVQRAINSMNDALNTDRVQNNAIQNNINTPKPAENTKPAVKAKKVIHTVAKGDNLTKIAIKYYGKNEGNKLANIEKIFEANKDILSSMSDLKVGQRLNIPSLPGVEVSQPAGYSAAAGTAARSNNSEKYKIYVVKEDDSLWKIAAKELGNGARYHEITKLNARILSDENTLRPGMKIKLPN